MNRTTPEAVQAILVGNYDSDDRPDLTPFIEQASLLVDEIDTNDTEGVMTTKALEMVERNLAAHFYHAADPLYTSRSTAGASGSFQGQYGMGFAGNTYGQNALLLDRTGTLARRNSELQEGGRRKPSMTWLGKPEMDSLIYRDRN